MTLITNEAMKLPDKDTQLESMTIGEKGEYCSSQCPNLMVDINEPCAAVCGKDGQPLFFYDYFLARCEGQMDAVESKNHSG